MDDLGARHSSLACLRQLEFDRIKIDRTLIAALDTGPQRGAAMAGAIAELDRRLGIPTVVEGAETEAQLAALRGLGLDAMQGSLLGRPGPVPEALRRLRPRARHQASGKATSPWA